MGRGKKYQPEQVVNLLGIESDDSLKKEVGQMRRQLLETGLASLGDRTDTAAMSIGKELESALKQVGKLDFSAQSSGIDKVRRSVVDAQRERLIGLPDFGVF